MALSSPLLQIGLFVIYGAAHAWYFYNRGREQGWRDFAPKLGDLCLLDALVKAYEQKYGRLSLEECRSATVRAIAEMGRYGVGGKVNETAMFRYVTGKGPIVDEAGPDTTPPTDRPHGS